MELALEIHKQKELAAGGQAAKRNLWESWKEASPSSGSVSSSSSILTTLLLQYNLMNGPPLLPLLLGIQLSSSLVQGPDGPGQVRTQLLGFAHPQEGEHFLLWARGPPSLYEALSQRQWRRYAVSCGGGAALPFTVSRRRETVKVFCST